MLTDSHWIRSRVPFGYTLLLILSAVMTCFAAIVFAFVPAKEEQIVVQNEPAESCIEENQK